MAFKRALWRSGLTYQQTCRSCRTTIQYTDEKLDFRPWYPDGFVYCPNCTTPLRHSECFAINGEGIINAQAAPTPSTEANGSLPAFCGSCGKKFRENDLFCTGCGAKRG